MEYLDEIMLYRFRVRTADGREAVSRIVASRRAPRWRLATAQEGEQLREDEEVLGAGDGKAEPMFANLRWSRDSFDHGDHATLMVDAPGLDGRTVRFAVEQQHGGDWTPYATVEGKVENGVAEVRLQLQHPAPGDRDASAADLRFSCELA